MHNLEEFIDEWLNIEKKEEKIKWSFIPSFQRMLRRRELEKQLEDEVTLQKEKIHRLGLRAKEFLSSVYYKELVEPYIRQTLKSGLQNLVMNGETMSESAFKTEVARIKTVLGLQGSFKLKIVSAEQQEEEKEIKEKKVNLQRREGQ